MKHPILRLLALCLFLFFWGHTASAQPGEPDDLTLIAYEANSSVTLLLTETGNPKNIIEFAVEHFRFQLCEFSHPATSVSMTPPQLCSAIPSGH